MPQSPESAVARRLRVVRRRIAAAALATFVAAWLAVAALGKSGSTSTATGGSPTTGTPSQSDDGAGSAQSGGDAQNDGFGAPQSGEDPDGDGFGPAQSDDGSSSGAASGSSSGAASGSSSGAASGSSQSSGRQGGPVTTGQS
jgi:hypothetical protein